tara:strand:+ start:738 stop:1262 length:525 start_codon:yes stop_codon:yes gene_type:complete
MRNFLLLLFVTALFSVNAQNDKFTLPVKEGDVLQGQWIVLDVEGTPKENYDKVINYVNKTYNTPSEVLKSQINGEYIRIEGLSDLFKNGGVMIPTLHTLEFKFKQDKIKLEVLSLISSGTSVIAYCTYAKTHTSKGKVKKMMMNYATKVTNGLNKLAEQIKLGLTEEVKAEDDW